MSRKDENPNSPAILILAAGVGQRMKSPLPKVLHEVGGKPILFHVLERARNSFPHAPIGLVIGHQKEKIEAYVRGESEFQGMKIQFIHQTEQKGTGHAAQVAMNSPWGIEVLEEGRQVFVLPGDSPLISEEMIQAMMQPLKPKEKVRLLTCRIPDPTGYGRVIREPGKGIQIVEHKDATDAQKQIQEISTSMYFFQPRFLSESLSRLKKDNAQGEYYLTDLIEMAGNGASSLFWANADELRGINDFWDLGLANRILILRWIKKWAKTGVQFLDPESTQIDATVELQPGACIHPGVILKGSTRIARGAIIGPRAVLTDVRVGENAVVKTGSVIEKSVIGKESQIGPYAHLRPESEVGEGVKIGNFVELKKTRVADHSSIAHLSYLGDAEVGRHVNIGCGFVTCNFDGRIRNGSRKHRTVIEDDVFLGSDCQAVAPIRIGAGAYIASGSTLTQDVEPDALAIARSRQVTKPGYAKKLRG